MGSSIFFAGRYNYSFSFWGDSFFCVFAVSDCYYWIPFLLRLGGSYTLLLFVFVEDFAQFVVVREKIRFSYVFLNFTLYVKTAQISAVLEDNY